jgi:hypothetical protein
LRIPSLKLLKRRTAVFKIVCERGTRIEECEIRDPGVFLVIKGGDGAPPMVVALIEFHGADEPAAVESANTVPSRVA